MIDKESNETKRAVAWEKAFIQLVQVCFLTSWFHQPNFVLKIFPDLFFCYVELKSSYVAVHVMDHIILALNPMCLKIDI